MFHMWSAYYITQNLLTGSSLKLHEFLIQQRNAAMLQATFSRVKQWPYIVEPQHKLYTHCLSVHMAIVTALGVPISQ